MEPLTLSVMVYFALFLGVWATAVSLILGRIIIKARHNRGVCRTSDKLMLAGTLTSAMVAFVVVFAWPGVIYMIPATVAFAEIASIPILGYVSEATFKHLRRMSNVPSEVDEHAAV